MANLAISISDSPDPVMVDQQLTYTINVSNQGPATATDVSLFNTLPLEATFVSATASQGTCSNTGKSCNIGILSNGQSATISIVVTATTSGRIKNVASVSSSTPDSNLANNTAEEETIVTNDGVEIKTISPNYGLDNTATLIYIEGSGFTEPLTVRLGNNPLNVTYIDPVLIVAVVPAELEVGSHEISIETSSGNSTLADAYRVLDAQLTDDLDTFAEWLWTNPSPLRVGYTQSSVGLLVQHLGGRNTLDSVTVEFRLDSAEGELLGRTLTEPLAPFATASTGPVIWEPTTQGEQTICAIIDPDDEIEETNEENNIICRSIMVLPLVEDIIPPEVESFVMADGAQSTTNRNVTLDVTATDYPIPGASGMQAIKFVEFEYMLGSRRWVPVEQSEWIAYTTAQADYPWSLVQTYGMRHMQAWAADNAGNISQVPRIDVMDLLPLEQAGYVAKRGVAFYRVYLEAGERLTATLTDLDGDPDLYIWGPNGQRWHSNNYTGVEAITFDAPSAGTYQIEVHGYSDAEYQLTFGETNVTQSRSAPFGNVAPKPRPSTPAVPLDEWPQYYPDGPPPVLPPDHIIYLPIIIR